MALVLASPLTYKRPRINYFLPGGGGGGGGGIGYVVCMFMLLGGGYGIGGVCYDVARCGNKLLYPHTDSAAPFVYCLS